jgi:hypothetical protein
MKSIKLETLLRLPEVLYSKVLSSSTQNGKDGYVYVNDELYSKIVEYMEKNL